MAAAASVGQSTTGCLTGFTVDKCAERLMRQHLPSVSITKDDAASSHEVLNIFPVHPPIITRTAATPLATSPHSSPVQLKGRKSDVTKNLSMTSTMSQSSSSYDADFAPEVSRSVPLDRFE